MKQPRSPAHAAAPASRTARSKSRGLGAAASLIVVLALSRLPGCQGGGELEDAASAHDARRDDARSDARVSEPGDDAGRLDPERLRVNVLREHPHDPDAFTQGLQWTDRGLYEGTGLEGRSSLRRIELADWSVQQEVALPPDVFGEGIAVVGERIFQLSWQEGIAFVWTRDTFERITEHRYEGEGWGLCWDGEHLVMSDGSDELTFRDADTFEAVRRVRVVRSGRGVQRLNELECVAGLVYANVWQTDDIARIDPRTGAVTGWIDASGLLTDTEARGADVLNGITYLPESERFLITGKLWPRSFEVTFVPAD